MYGPHQIAVVDFNFVWVHLLSLSRWQGMSKRDHKVTMPQRPLFRYRLNPPSRCRNISLPRVKPLKIRHSRKPAAVRFTDSFVALTITEKGG
jgi:hypothetical protein